MIVAALVAALGTGMVLLYVRGADIRAEASQQPVKVLKAVQRIETGERVSDAQAAGKITLDTVPRKQVLEGAKDTVVGLEDDVALSTIYPNEQIIAAKFGPAGKASALTIPAGNIAISVTMSETGRVAGFVEPGNTVAVFATSSAGRGAADATRLLLPRVQVIAVGSTTVDSPTPPEGAPPAVEQTLVTLSVNQVQAEKLMFAASHGELSFALLNDKSKVATGPGVGAANLFQ